MLCKSYRNEYVTIMLDYYGMPDTTPSKRLEQLIPNLGR